METSTVFISAWETFASCFVKNLASSTRHITTLLEAGTYIIIPVSSKGALFNPWARAFTTVIDNLRLRTNYILAILLALASCRLQCKALLAFDSWTLTFTVSVKDKWVDTIDSLADGLTKAGLWVE